MPDVSPPPHGPELVVGALATALLVLTIVGAVIALRELARARRDLAPWILLSVLLGPLGVTAYFARRPRSTS